MNIVEEAVKVLAAETLGIGVKTYDKLMVLKNILKTKKELCK